MQGRPSSGVQGMASPLLLVLALLVDSSLQYNLVRRDPFGDLGETLHTLQRAACDGDLLALECPRGTKVSLQLVRYGREAPSEQVRSSCYCSYSCSGVPPHPPLPPTLHWQGRPGLRYPRGRQDCRGAVPGPQSLPIKLLLLTCPLARASRLVPS